MSKPGSPLLGYNTNVRHKGKLYHIQTEDSGVQHPHIVTHLFADGGRVIASKKTSYAEHVGSDDLQATVKRLMQEQHKAMFIALRDGVYDEDEASATGTQGAEASGRRKRGSTSHAEQAEGSAAEAAGARRDETPSGTQPVDVEALERAADQWSRESAATGDSASGKASAGASTKSGAGRAHPRPRATGARTASGAAPPGDDSRDDAPARGGRYQATRPAQPSARPDPQNESIFGSDLMSERSLDEVILGYLAEDLDETSE